MFTVGDFCVWFGNPPAYRTRLESLTTARVAPDATSQYLEKRLLGIRYLTRALRRSTTLPVNLVAASMLSPLAPPDFPLWHSLSCVNLAHDKPFFLMGY